MAMSGIKLTPRCHTTYEEVQRMHMHRYAIFKIDQKKGEIDLEKVSLVQFEKYREAKNWLCRLN